MPHCGVIIYSGGLTKEINNFFYGKSHLFIYIDLPQYSKNDLIS